jgi:drug/metabolite transporter (DMT)-like permease
VSARLLTGLALAIGASVTLNAGFLLQHAGSAPRAPITPRHPLATLGTLLRSPLWALGAVAGLSGWAMHVAALSRAPLSLVQAFVAGGLALAAPMAAIGLRHRLEPRERAAIVLMIIALVLLALGLGAEVRRGHFAGGALAAYLAALVVAAGVLAAAGGARRPAALGVAGGVLYGAADMAIKALTGLSGGVLTSPWLGVAALTTLAAFFAFQRGLQAGRPLTVIALMTAATNATSIGGGFVVFGDPLGRTPALAAAHALAFVLVGLAAWRLAPTQSRLAGVRVSSESTQTGHRGNETTWP